MSGSNYVGNAKITFVVNVGRHGQCDLQTLINQLEENEGVESVTIGGTLNNQLVLVLKLPDHKIRGRRFFSKPQKITAVMGINIDCQECLKNTKKVISSDPGFEGMNIQVEKKIVTVKGMIALNQLAEKLEKKLRRFVKFISVNVDYHGGGICGSDDGDPKFTMDAMSKNVGEIFK